MRIKYWKSSYADGENPMRSVNVNPTTWPKDDQRKLLRSLAHDWGSVNEQWTVFHNGRQTAMQFDCSGHGGYMVFSLDKIPNYEGFEVLSSEVYGHNWPWQPFYVYSFEEDCNWALFFLGLPYKHRQRIVKHSYMHYVNELGSMDAAVKKMREFAEWTAKQYHHDLLNKIYRFDA